MIKFKGQNIMMTTDSTDVNFLFQLYDITLRSLLDKHAPERTVNRRLRPQTPWYNTECLLMKRKVRQLETVYYRRRLPVCYRQWRNKVVRYNCLLRTKQQSFWSSGVREADGNPRKLWKTLSNLLTPAVQPVHDFTAEDFSVTFKDKVDSIRASTAGVPAPTPPTTSCQSQLDSYSLTTVADVKRLLGLLPNKQCSLDPVPTWLVKSLCNMMPIILTNLINSSLFSSIFPSSQQHTIVTPALKKPQLNPTTPSNYRPISNLSFVSKLLERVMAKQLTAYLESNNLLPANQSAYRRGHSTKTAMSRSAMML